MDKYRIVFFGTEAFSAPTLELLIKSNFEVVAVITKPDTLRGRGHKLEQPAVKKIALANNINVLQPNKVTEILPELSKMQPDIGVLVSYGWIIPQSVIDAFPEGIVNGHPSLLPKYRGPSPIESAITNGDRETGVSIMQLSREMDAGPVYLQEKSVLNGSETQSELYEKFAKRGAELLTGNLEKISRGELKPISQNDTDATYCRLLSKEDGILDPVLMTADECERKIRAYQVWPKTRLNFLGENLIVTRAKVLPNFAGDSWPDVIKCKDETTLQIVELVAPSGKKMKTADYLRGVRSL